MNLFDLFAAISLDTSGFDGGVKEVTSKGESLASKLGSGLATAGKVAAKGLAVVGTASTAVVGGLLALESSTEEYRVAQGKLNAAFEAAGSDADMAAYAYNEFYKILGDSDTAVEASQLLSKLSTDGEDVAYWTHIAAGVYGEFGDSLPIEGLIEASNETAKVGQVTGSLADALNWVGISEDEVNEKLSGMSDETERADYLMNLLMDTYDASADAFYKNNASLVEARENQAVLDETLAKLGETVSTVKNKLMSEFLPAISNVASAFSDVLSGAEGADEAFSDAIQGLISLVVSKLPEFLNMGVQILTSLASGIVQSIPALIAAIPQIVIEIKTALSALLPQILEMGTQLLGQFTRGIEVGLPDMISRIPTIVSQFLDYITSQLPTVLEKGVEMLNSLVNGIINSIPHLIAALPQIIISFVTFITQNLPSIIQAGISILANLIVGIIKAIPQLIAALPQIIAAIVEGIGALMGSIIDIGKNIVQGIWDGIASAWNGLVSWFNGLWDSLFGGRSVDVSVNGSANTSGSHAGGLDYVPYNGYIAELHRGETVLTRAEADEWRKGNAGISSIGNITITVNGAKYSDEESLAQRIAVVLENTFERENAVYGQVLAGRRMF